jgi:hypothetical protein
MCSQSDPSFVLWLSSYREKEAIKHLLTIELARNSSKRQKNWMQFGGFAQWRELGFIENQAESVSIFRPLRRIADNLA